MSVRNVAREKLEQGQLSLGVGIRITRSVEVAKMMATMGSPISGTIWKSRGARGAARRPSACVPGIGIATSLMSRCYGRGPPASRHDAGSRRPSVCRDIGGAGAHIRVSFAPGSIRARTRTASVRSPSQGFMLGCGGAEKAMVTSPDVAAPASISLGGSGVG